MSTFVVIAIYLVVVMYIGLRMARRTHSGVDLFLAGRRLGWIPIGFSLFATNISSEHLIGLAGSGAAAGLAVGAYEWMAVFCIFTLIWFFLPRYLKSKVFTMPEFLERRYSEGARWYLAIISIVGYVLTKISVTIAAGGDLLARLLARAVDDDVLDDLLGQGRAVELGQGGAEGRRREERPPSQLCRPSTRNVHAWMAWCSTCARRGCRTS